MKEQIAWFGRTVLLPLLPAIIGAFIRAVYSGKWNLDAIDSAELGFSVALIGVIVLGNVYRLNDKSLRDSLSPLFVIALALALCLFAGSVLVKLLHDGEQADFIDSLRSTGALSQAALEKVGQPTRLTQISAQIRSATIVIAILTVFGAVVARARYPLDD